MKVVWAIALGTFKEAVRDRILHGIAFFAICLILFSLVLGELSLGEEIRCTLDVGLAGISLFSVVTAIFLGSTLLYKEVEKRTIYTVLSKPITRVSYFLGKYVGILFTLAVIVLSLAFMLEVIIVAQGGTPTVGVLFVILLVLVEVALVTAVSMLFTSFSSPFLSGIFSFATFVIGRNLDIAIEFGSKPESGGLGTMVASVSRVLPRLYLFYPSGKIVEGSWVTIHETFIDTGYLVTAVGYGLMYSLVLFGCASLIFWRRDFV